MPDWVIDEASERANAARFLERHRTLHALVHSGARVERVVVQDEFTHDIVARLPETYGGFLAVFDST